MPNEQYAVMPLSDYQDTCNAIRAKTGKTAVLKSNELKTEINSIEGGAVIKTEGTVTLDTDGYFPLITHNLGTQKIAAMICPVDGSTVVAQSGYRTYTTIFINITALEAGSVWNLDFTNYNSENFPNVVSHTIGSSDTYPRVANGQVSPWTSQSSIDLGNYSGAAPNVHILTDNTYKCNLNFAAGTYKWKIWKLE